MLILFLFHLHCIVLDGSCLNCIQKICIEAECLDALIFDKSTQKCILQNPPPP